MLHVPGLGEEGLTSGTMFDGIATKEASEVEEPMFQKLGVMEARSSHSCYQLVQV